MIIMLEVNKKIMKMFFIRKSSKPLMKMEIREEILQCWNLSQIMQIGHYGSVLMAASFSRLALLFYEQASDFLITVAEPVCRPEFMHDYNLTPHSLYAAVSAGFTTETVLSVLNALSKTKLPKDVIDFIHASTSNYGKVKLVLKKNRYFVESAFPELAFCCFSYSSMVD
ncbi:general transcription and DNA repair factor IIH helicase/translocase subunit XPB1-like [Apium graveolens]|uniref:general transcription and DNA repair factor IIH helicase/translocase subunit XPB1-like n=1 Tax=Apium graveolens TaxID=4045 RepID=UPI003D79DF82